MKYKVAMLMAILLCILAWPSAVSAQTAKFVYSDEDIEELYYDFDYLSSMVEYMFGSDEAIAYWKYADSIKEKKAGNWFIGAANRLIGETPDKEYYTELLTKMIVLFEYSAAQQVQSQSQFDNLKNIEDYAFDLIDIGATVVGLDGPAEDVVKGLKLMSGGIDLAKATINDLKYYELSIRNYTQSELFLKAVSEYSDNELLSEAAYDLRKGNRLLFKERVKLISSVAGNLGEFGAKNFFADFSFSVMKNIKEYKTDSTIRDYVDYGEKFYKLVDGAVDIAQVSFKALMIGADGNFGTTDTFRRHNEMKTMADIAQALVKAYEAVPVSLNASAQTAYSNIRTKCEYYKLLLSTHLRGEYLMYSLITEDAGLLSDLSNWVDEYFRDEDKTIKSWYEEQTDYFEEYYNRVNVIFARLSRIKMVVHGGFELHDGFIVEIEQKDTVPEGYIGVYSFEDLKKIADSCPSGRYDSTQKTEFNTAKYILMNDIYCPAEYETAGTFYGVLDGNGYTMHNLSKSLFEGIGNAVVKNLGMEVNYIVDTQDTECIFGVIAGGQYAWVNDQGVLIDNCFLNGSIDITCRGGKLGGLIGYGEGITIVNCYNEADISIHSRQGSSVGGICGTNAAISNCYNTGDISAYASCANTINAEQITVNVGGIQGYNYSDSIRNCYNTGSISSQAPVGCWVTSGGIVGYNFGAYYNAYIENCYNIGSVSSDWMADYDTEGAYGQWLRPSYSTGGIIGESGDNLYIIECWNSGDISGEHFVGGIIGRAHMEYDDSVENCYNTGCISAVQYAGGIVGKDFYATGIKNSFNAGDISGAAWCGAIAGTMANGEEHLSGCYYLDNGITATSAGINYSGAEKLTAEQMADSASFEGYDFFDTWIMREGSAAPELRQ